MYGNVTNTHAEEFQQRRRDLLAGQLHDAALANYYHDLAGVWRRLWDVTEKKKRLIQLRWPCPCVLTRLLVSCLSAICCKQGTLLNTSAQARSSPRA